MQILKKYISPYLLKLMRTWSKLDVYKNVKAKIILQKNGEVIKALKTIKILC